MKKAKKGEENDRSPVTADEKERQALATQIEGDLPYDRALYINETKRYLKRSIEDILTVGKLLLVIQQREGYGEFVNIVEDEIGIPHTTAYRFMNAALKSEAHPAINFSQLGQVSKVYALLEAPEEELKKFEQLGLFAGKDADELASMSHKELRELVKTLKTDSEEIVKKKVKEVKTENEMLKQEIREWHKIIPPALENASKGEKQLYYAQAKYDDFESALSALIFAEMEIDDIKIGAKVEGLIRTMHARIVHFAEKWEAHKKGDIQG